MENVRRPPFHIQDDTLLKNIIDYLTDTFRLRVVLDMMIDTINMINK